MCDGSPPLGGATSAVITNSPALTASRNEVKVVELYIISLFLSIIRYKYQYNNLIVLKGVVKNPKLLLPPSGYH